MAFSFGGFVLHQLMKRLKPLRPLGPLNRPPLG